MLELVDKTTDKDYTRNEAKEGEALRIKISEEALRGRYEKASLFSMPTDGNYAGFSYYLPNSRVEEDKENYGEMLTAVLKKDMKITLKDKTSGEEKEITAEELAVLVDGKGEEAYALPEIETDENSERKSAFAKTERSLRENVPKEMLEQEKWVAVRTRYDREKGKLNKFLLNCKTGKAAESDNPETWTDFESACKYARANGGVAVAYALDGKDKICCVDIDGCIDNDGNLSALSQAFLSKSGKTFAEYSVSGRGIHIWGKTDGADIRTFSKDGDFEFYQKAHFITMTGNNTYSFSEHKRQITIQNMYFADRFGRNDFEKIAHRSRLGDAMAYILKYIEKSGERIVYSKGLPQFFISDIMDEDVICTIGMEDQKLLLFDDFSCWDEGCYMGKVSPEVIAQMRPSD